MPWFSILPESLSFIETLLIKVFLLLSAISIGPWLLLLVYDAVLYLFRTATYDIPVIGGRARNRPIPRAPSLAERPSGRPRGFSMNLPGLSPSPDRVEAADAVDGLKQRLNKLDNSRTTNEMIVDERSA